MSNRLEQFRKELNRVAKVLGKSVLEVSRSEFLANTQTETSSRLDKIGGFKAAVSTLYPEAAVQDQHIQGLKLVKSFVQKQVKKESVDTYMKDEFLDVFKEVMSKAPVQIHKPIKQVKKSNNSKRTIVAHVSDTHFGANIDASEMSGVNSFNWTVASRRMAFFADQIVRYKPQHRQDTDLVVAINGDIIAGVIHDTEWFADLLTTQFAGTISILSQFISYVAQHFNSVRVVMTPGNHGRAMHKLNKGRATTHKWDSYETMIYIAVKNILEGKFKNVSCDIPKSPFAIIDIHGHKFLQTHGDTVINVGNPGSSINMRSINTQINKLNSSPIIKQDETFAGILVGHVHTACIQILENGTTLLINSTLSGNDPYAQSVGFFNNEPSQTMFEVTADYAVGDIRLIKVKAADSNTSLDKIIKPFTPPF